MQQYYDPAQTAAQQFAPAPQRQQYLEKKKLRSLGNLAGYCVLTFFLVSNLLGLLVYAPALAKRFGLDLLLEKDIRFSAAFYIFSSVLGIFLPFLLLFLLQRRRSRGRFEVIGKAYGKSLIALSVPVGMLVSLGANYAASLFITAVESTGVTLLSPEISTEYSLGGAAMLVLQVAVIPAVVEEFAMRGVMLQALRRYGDWFAVTVTSVLFAVMHGNLVQAPFALILGFALGWLVLMTGSLWTGIFIHFFSNFYAVIMMIFIDRFGEEDPGIALASSIIFFVILIGGSLSAVLLHFRTRGRRLCPPCVDLHPAARHTAFWLNPGMLLALAVMLLNTWMSVKL